MNTTDELRAMLDEHGVNWDYGITGTATTKFRANGVDLTFMPMRDGLVCTTILTPAQAIAVALGQTDPRERGLIPHFWTGDWTLHIEAARLPERIDVTLPDQRGREVYSARVHRFVSERKDVQEALERRIDELCAEVERLRQELAIHESSEQEKVIDYLGKECADWEVQYLALADENAKLRTQLADVTESVGRMEERCAKLRELVRELWSMAYWYAYEAAPVSMQALMRVEKELQALGIEVPK